METLIVIIVIFAVIIVAGFIKTDADGRRQRGRSSSDNPKSLPWFDKDYQRKKRKKKKYFWDD